MRFLWITENNTWRRTELEQGRLPLPAGERRLAYRRDDAAGWDGARESAPGFPVSRGWYQVGGTAEAL